MVNNFLFANKLKLKLLYIVKLPNYLLYALVGIISSFSRHCLIAAVLFSRITIKVLQIVLRFIGYDVASNFKTLN